MADGISGVRASAGFASETGPRERNEDFAGAVFGWELPQPRHDIVAAIADGIGGAKGGRIAAETAVRGFLDGFCDQPETMEVRRAAASVITALNGWIYAHGKRDPNLAGMGCTFTALVLRGRIAHILHVGDTRAYRLGGERLTCLTVDHVRESLASGRSKIPKPRAGSGDRGVRLDHATQPLARHDRFPAVQLTLACMGALTTLRHHRRHPCAIALVPRDTAFVRWSCGCARNAGSTDKRVPALGGRRCRTADDRIRRYRRHHQPTAAATDANRWRNGRWLPTQSAGVGRPIYSLVRSDRRSRRWRGKGWKLPKPQNC